MLQIESEPFCIHISESCGLTFAPQILEVAIPSGSPEFFWLCDTQLGRYFPVQRSQRNPEIGFLRVEIAPFDKLALETAGDGAGTLPELTADGGILKNEHLELKLASDLDGPTDALEVSGPVVSVSGRGQSYFDSRNRVLRATGQWLENGPLRAVWYYDVEFESGGRYSATITLDAGEEFAVVDEELGGEPGAQLVWDFSAADWPREVFLLDSTPGGTFRQLHPHMDARHARLAAWTQYQQLHDFSDGFAILWPDSLLGMVTLDGGSWRGNRLNHVELWTRRFWDNDRRTRRLEPWESKADSMPGPEHIPARGEPLAQAHCCLEAWIGATGGQPGHRRFALVSTRRERLFPGARDGRRGDGSRSGHFEKQAARDRYRGEQSLLRQIQIQRGLLPLQDLAGKSFDWSIETYEPVGFAYPHPLLEQHLRHQGEDEAGRITRLANYLESRVYGFWEGGGSAHTNCVVGRAIAPEMLHFEYLERNGRLSAEQSRLFRAHFAFLCHLFHSENYYPGRASMQPNGHPDSFEPTIAGMANQNFLTDVICVGAMGSAVFRNHPQAGAWRDRFRQLWRRQLEFHRYPESGVWEESHTYFEHVLHTVLAVLLRLRDDGYEASGQGFQDPMFHSLCESILIQLMPRHAQADGYRHLIAWGDHEAGRHDHFLATYDALAEALAPYEHELAGQLAWVSHEFGGATLKGMEPLPVPWVSGPVQGLGYCFRATNTAGQQSLLALRAGAAWGHHHHDDGSIQFWARGQALTVDAAFGHVPNEAGRKFGAGGHSRWSPRDIEPFDYFWRFNRGWISTADDEAVFPYAVAWTPVYMYSRGTHAPAPLWPMIQHWRTVVRLAADTFLILDESDAAVPQTLRFHVPGEVQVHDGMVEVQVGDVQLSIVALMGVDRIHREGTDVPRQNGMERFSTTEISLETGLGPRSAVLLCAEPLTVERITGDDFDAWTLRAADWWAHLVFGLDGLRLQRVDGAVMLLDETVLRAK